MFVICLMRLCCFGIGCVLLLAFDRLCMVGLVYCLLYSLGWVCYLVLWCFGMGWLGFVVAY